MFFRKKSLVPQWSVLVTYPVITLGWAETAAAGAGALPEAKAGEAAMEIPVMAIVPAMAIALIFFVKVMSKLLCCEVLAALLMA